MCYPAGRPSADGACWVTDAGLPYLADRTFSPGVSTVSRLERFHPRRGASKPDTADNGEGETYDCHENGAESVRFRKWREKQQCDDQ